MSAAREKMRQISARLKSAGEKLRQTARLRAQQAADAGKKASEWPRSRWAARRIFVSKAVETPWQSLDDSVQADPGGVTGFSPANGGWRARYPKLVKGLRIAAVALAVFIAMPYLFILIYRIVDPPFSALMLRNALLGEEVHYEWVDLDEISPNLARAAVLAEDSRFCSHWGVDWGAVGEVLDDLEDGDAPRGASTIPMQTAKNLFLWPEQSYVRKILEVPLAYFMTLIWPKQRVAEIYLNIAEWGPGIYGAEAAARHHFGKPASAINEWEAALLAASLPNPFKRIAGRPGPQTRRLASRIQARVQRESQDVSCIFDG